ncbi:MAG: TIGR02285 family protein [Rhodoferax sp.]|nr:TIGR02285 family protein [Rhodoferax sp.]
MRRTVARCRARRHLKWYLVTAMLSGGYAAADTIAWVGTDFPPMAMSQGEHAHGGYIDALYKHLKESLPQHDFHEEIVPWTRAMAMAQRGGAYCLISAFQTPERDAFLRFTAPYGYLYPIGIVIRAQDQERFAPYLNPEGNFLLDAALKQSGIGMGVASSRSYGPRIDGLIKPLISNRAKNIHQSYQDESTKFLLAMLAGKRFDYMLAYPSEVEYYGGPSNAFRFYPIHGNHELLPGRFSCTKSPETDRVFADVSRLVPTKNSQAVFMAAYERWLPKYLVKSYRQRLADLPVSSP